MSERTDLSFETPSRSGASTFCFTFWHSLRDETPDIRYINDDGDDDELRELLSMFSSGVDETAYQTPSVNVIIQSNDSEQFIFLFYIYGFIVLCLVPIMFILTDSFCAISFVFRFVFYFIFFPFRQFPDESHRRRIGRQRYRWHTMRNEGISVSSFAVCESAHIHTHTHEARECHFCCSFLFAFLFLSTRTTWLRFLFVSPCCYDFVSTFSLPWMAGVRHLCRRSVLASNES